MALPPIPLAWDQTPLSTVREVSQELGDLDATWRVHRHQPVADHGLALMTKTVQPPHRSAQGLPPDAGGPAGGLEAVAPGDDEAVVVTQAQSRSA